jgi:hypothetical protein
MELDYTVKGQVKVTMLKFVEEILAAYDKADPKGAGVKTSAAPSDLFKVDDSCEKLPPDKMVAFHNIVAKTLFATKRARPDTCTAIAFLQTRVREPDKDDWKKLSHLMKYLRGTKTLPLILGSNGTGILKWWIDAAFAVHPNMRGHSGGGLSLGRGFPIVSSTKQKLNTRSSTEAEIVGVDDFMPAVCWTRYFMEAQGYPINDNVVYQDNQSSMLLEKNGKASSSKRTKHINIRYFFITDRIGKGEISLKWCPTGDMTGDYASKPLQGALFKDFRDQIMGVTAAKDPRPSKTPAKTPDNGAKIFFVKSSMKDAKVGLSSKTIETPQECVGTQWTLVERRARKARTPASSRFGTVKRSSSDILGSGGSQKTIKTSNRKHSKKTLTFNENSSK